MKRAVILSDSHGDETGLRWMLERLWKTTGAVDYYIHLGDGARDFQRLENFLLMRDPKCIPVGVKGNCDLGVDNVPMQRILRLGDAYLLACHGHHYAVKQTYGVLAHHARELGCQAALFGHTHCPLCKTEDGLLLLNPGSAADGRLALLTVDDAGQLQAELREF